MAYRRRISTQLLFTLFAAACEQSTVSPPSDSAAASVVGVPNGVQARIQYTSDPAIVADDSRYVAYVSVVDSSIIPVESYTDPNSLQPMSVIAVPPSRETLLIDVGHATDGTAIANTFFSEDPIRASPTDRISRVRIAGNSSQVFDGRGLPFEANFDGVPAADPAQALGLEPNMSLATGFVLNPGDGTFVPMQLQGTAASSTPKRAWLIPKGHRVEHDSDSLVVVAGANSAVKDGGGDSVEWHREYRRDKSGAMALSVLRQRSFGTTPKGISQSVRELRFSWVRLSVNAAKERERVKESRAGAFSRPPIPPTNLLACPVGQADCSVAGGPPTAGDCNPTPMKVVSTGTPAAPKLLLEHGIFSDNGTWCYVENNILQAFQVGQIAEPTTGGGFTSAPPSLSRQADSVRAKLQQYRLGSEPYIAIGHSQGGLIGRRLAQQSTSDGTGLISGVLTIDTPHSGAAIATPLRASNTVLGLGTVTVAAFSAETYYFASLVHPGFAKFASALVGAGTAGATDALSLVFSPWYQCRPSGSLCDDAPGSAFLTDLNQRGEQFTRAAIVNRTPNDYLAFRIGGDMLCRYSLSATCGGRSAARWWHRARNQFVAVSVVSGILGFFWQPAWWATKVSAVAVGWIQSVNWIFNAGVGADAVGGDGIVGLTSQQYPNVTASRQYFVMDGDTHVGVQKSAQTWLQMRTSLRNDFNLQPLSSYP